MNVIFDRIAPETLIQLAEGVYLLAGVPDLVPDSDLVILYDRREWEPATYTQSKPKEMVGGPDHLHYLKLSRVNGGYDMVTHICRTWLDMKPLNGQWWNQHPTIFRGEPLGKLPLLTTVFPHRNVAQKDVVVSD